MVRSLNIKSLMNNKRSINHTQHLLVVMQPLLNMPGLKTKIPDYVRRDRNPIIEWYKALKTLHIQGVRKLHFQKPLQNIPRWPKHCKRSSKVSMQFECTVTPICWPHCLQNAENSSKKNIFSYTSVYPPNTNHGALSWFEKLKLY